MLRRILSAGAVTALLAMTTLAAPVGAATGESAQGLSGRVIPVKADTSRLVEPKLDAGNGVPAAAHDEVLKAVDLLGDKFNTAEWVSDSNTILIHLNQGLAATEKDKVDAVFEAVNVTTTVDDYSVATLETLALKIASSTGAPGEVVVSAGPNADNSGLDVVLNSDTLAKSRVQSLESTLSSVVDVPVSFTASEAPEPASSRTSDPYPPHWGGAKMSTPASEAGKVTACSTGFGIGKMNGSTLVTENLTAHHCGNVDTQWRTGISLTSTILGLMKDANAGGPDLQKLVGAEFGPVMYYGSPTADVGIPVRGFVYPILNDYYCNNGAPSGTVCGNKVTSMNQTICYLGMPRCYTGNTYTDRDGGGPAVGNGDSGGPTFAIRNGQAHAAGIISGMFNMTSTCEGEPPTETRQCGNTSVIAPVTHFLSRNAGYGILVAG